MYCYISLGMTGLDNDAGHNSCPKIVKIWTYFYMTCLVFQFATQITYFAKGAGEFWPMTVIGALWMVLVFANTFFFSIYKKNWVERSFDIVVENQEEENELKSYFRYPPIIIWVCVVFNITFGTFTIIDYGEVGEILSILLYPFAHYLAYKIVFLLVFVWYTLAWLWPVVIIASVFHVMQRKVCRLAHHIAENEYSFLEIRNKMLHHAEQVEKLNDIYSDWATVVILSNIPLLVFILFRLLEV